MADESPPHVSSPDTRQVFLSYAREDQERAEVFARALAGRGLNVWWDRKVLPGQVFDSEIASRLARSQCVVVLWSAKSIQKRWVRDEAEDAASRNILVPVLIDDVRIPLGFRRFQTETLVDWDGQVEHPSFLRLMAAIDSRLGAGPAPVAAPTSWGARRRLPSLALAVGPTVIALGLAWGLAVRKVPTRFELEATVSRVDYTIDAREGLVQILASLPVRSMVVEKFSSFEIEPDRSEVGEPALYDIASDTFPADGWRPLTMTTSVLRFTPASADRVAKIAVAAAGRASSPVTILDAIRVAPRTAVTVEAGRPGQGLTLRLRGDAPRALLLWDGPVELVVDHALVDGITIPGNADSRSYRFHPKAASPVAQFIGHRNELVLSLRPKVQASDVLQIGSAIAVASVDFTTLDGTGRRVSSITAPSVLRFPGSSRLRERRLETSDVLRLGDLRHAVLQQVRYDPARGLVVLLAGEAGQVRLGVDGARIDVRSSSLSRLKDERPAIVVLALGLLLATTVIGVVALVRRTRA